MPPQEPTNREPRVQYQASTSSSDYHHTTTYKSTPQSLRIHLWSEIAEQWKTAFPAIAGMLLYKFPWLISLRFVGGIGAEELAAAALASTLCNVTGLSLSVGLSSAADTRRQAW
jgi:Na+-driven multidrug efflux pump